MLWFELKNLKIECALILHSQLKIWGHCMSCSNSSVNPFVYAFTGNNFRKAFKHAFPAILLWRSRGRVRVGNTDAEEGVETDHQAPKGEAEMHFLSSGPKRPCWAFGHGALIVYLYFLLRWEQSDHCSVCLLGHAHTHTHTLKHCIIPCDL